MYFKILKTWIILLSIIPLSGCEKELEDVKVLYQNDFESSDLDHITGGILHDFNGSKMLGSYNNDGFLIEFTKLSKHSTIIITFDLYIHDSWDGNAPSPGGPDLWIMEIDAPNKSETDPNYFRTSFSNTSCELCDFQSFPGTYPFSKSPRSGSTHLPVPGLCYYAASDFGSAHYPIEKSFRHSGDALIIQFYDELVQTNVTYPSCDESWSLDNLKILTLKYD